MPDPKTSYGFISYTVNSFCVNKLFVECKIIKAAGVWIIPFIFNYTAINVETLDLMYYP
jgi:hypothetical protein